MCDITNFALNLFLLLQYSQYCQLIKVCPTSGLMGVDVNAFASKPVGRPKWKNISCVGNSSVAERLA